MGKVKYCPSCQKHRNISTFTSKGKRCKPCNKTYLLNWYKNNKEKVRLDGIKYRKKFKDKIRKAKKLYYVNNYEKIKKNRRIWLIKNKERINKYYRDKRKKDINYRLKVYLRIRLRKYLIKQTNSKFLEKYLGCTIKEFRKYMQNNFKKGMNWRNYGKWHIDHIIPLYKAKNKVDILRLSHYTNLQPLWAIENLRKNKF